MITRTLPIGLLAAAALLGASAASAEDPAKSNDAKCFVAYGTSISAYGNSSLTKYGEMGGYYLGTFSVHFTVPASVLADKVPATPARELKATLARCKAESDKAAQDLLAK